MKKYYQPELTVVTLSAADCICASINQTDTIFDASDFVGNGSLQ